MTPYYDRGGIQIFHGDCLDVLPQIDLGAMHTAMVITDPPYNARKQYGESTNDHQEWPDWVAWLDERRVAWERLAAEAMFFLSQTAYRQYIRHSQLEVDWDCIWYKRLSMAVCAAPFMPHWEHIVYCGKRKKGQRRNRDGTFVKHSDGGFGSDVFDANVELGTERFGHPTPKPMKLMRELVSRCADDVYCVIDPFCGSGTTLRAAKDLGGKAIGIEIEERWCESAAKRLEQEVLAL